MQKLLFLCAFILVSCGKNTVIKGLDGVNGINGNDGKNGVSLVSTEIPATTSQCQNGGYLILIAQDTLGTGLWDAKDKPENSFLVCNGLKGDAGAQGLQGIQGVQGIAGKNGTNGTNGTVITPIEFCKDKPSYPNTFPEYGLLINGIMFGVYSENGGFLAELPAGTYSSMGINSACTFTINKDGTITR
jgi:hypothetical protein